MKGRTIHFGEDGAAYLESENVGSSSANSNHGESLRNSKILTSQLGGTPLNNLNPLAMAIEKLRANASRGSTNPFGSFNNKNAAESPGATFAINFEASATKQCVQALRYLCSKDR